MFITRFTTIATLALGLAITSITTANAEVSTKTTPEHVHATAHHSHHYAASVIGPKGGDTRKGIYRVPHHLTGAVVTLTYPDQRGGFIGPKGGDTRRYIPLLGVAASRRGDSTHLPGCQGLHGPQGRRNPQGHPRC